MRYINTIYLDNLIKHTKGKNRGEVNWNENVGKTVKGVYENKEFEILIVSREDKHLFVKYLNNKLFKISIANFKGCKLGGVLGKYTSDFKFDIGYSINNYIIMDREIRIGKYNEKHYKFKCNKCGYEGWKIEGNIKKRGCPVCNPTPRIVVIGYNDIPTTEPWMVKYFQGGIEEAKLYTRQSNKKVYPICPDCGRVKDSLMSISTIYSRASIGCMCGDKKSFPEKFAFSILEQLGVEFEIEYSPDWCKYIDFNDINKIKTGRYDFKLNDYPFILEMDGGWHNIDNNMSGKTKEESKYIDDIKDKLAKSNGYEVIRIDCYYINKNKLKYIKTNMINSKLNEIFDLSTIDWSKAEYNANKNLKKYVYQLVKEGVSKKEISIITKLHISTINRYFNDYKVWIKE